MEKFCYFYPERWDLWIVNGIEFEKTITNKEINNKEKYF